MASDDTTGNDMQSKIRAQFEAKSTEELEQICYNRKDEHLYTEETLELIREILKVRSNGPSPQPPRASSPTPPPVQRSQDERLGDKPQKKANDFFSFRTMFTVEWVKASYVFGTIAIVVVGLWMCGEAIADESLDMLYIGLVLLGIGPIVWRLYCEAWIVFFRIHETLVSIDKKLGR